MSNLSSYAVTEKWPATHPERLQLYSLPTPNGVKASIMLEEIELAYEPHRVDFGRGDQHTPEFLSVSPNNKIPAILDPNGPHGQPLALFESGAILLYLAEKSGQLVPRDPAERLKCIQWLLFQIGGIGPMFGQLGYFVKFDGKEVQDPRPRRRYIDETLRLLGVLDRQLKDKDWIMGGQYSIADIAVFPWIRGMLEFYEAGPLVDFEQFTNVRRVYDAFMARPAVQRGLDIPAPE
ncbi:GST-like protein [Halopseudomonas sabulinigri]|uniref:GST-like protein n=1 Tax=Halopseudomonas sabulinigri TaxID=472181 RepID=A0A1H1TNT1_9GAMM|nr:glutathione binding-like protein [Halopseudomonas sabulinigri]SDS61721.1 GST-like protein [Halopseudomonas sabulinigri]